MSASEVVIKQFAENLIAHRKRVGISQEELGFRSHLHRTEIGMLERGTRLARIDTLIKLAGAMEIKPEDLLQGLQWSPRASFSGEFTTAPQEG